VPGDGRFASDNHGGGAHARGASTAGSGAVIAAWRDPSSVVVLGCGASGCGAGSLARAVGAGGRTAPDATTIVAARGGAGSLGGAVNCGAAAACGAAACGAALCVGAAAGTGAAPGFMLGSSHSPQYRHFTAAS
jgi:hypothetical protein